MNEQHESLASLFKARPPPPRRIAAPGGGSDPLRARQAGRSPSPFARAARRSREIAGRRAEPGRSGGQLPLAIADLRLHLGERLRGALSADGSAAELLTHLLRDMLEPGQQLVRLTLSA
jgi:hypothetical protein